MLLYEYYEFERMIRMKDVLEKKIKNILLNLGIKNPKVILDYPAHFEMGDLTTNVAMAYAKELSKEPLDLAKEIVSHLEAELPSLRIEAVPPGFINFFFDKEYFEPKPLEKINILKDQKIFVEHTQPNPFKEFHIGHLMNNTIGESVARIVKANGAEVKTCSYHGDVGLHIAEAVWAIQKGIDLKQAYAYGHKAGESDEKVIAEILEINKKIYDKSDAEINKSYENGRKTSLEFFGSVYEKLDSHFDYHFYESESGDVGKELVLKNIGTVFEESDGAVVFKGENFEPKTHTRVFLTKEKLPTYEAKELGLAKIKKEKWSYDKSVTITGNEQDSFFDVVEVAIGEVFPELKGKLHHLSHGMLKLPTGKMSSRTGTIISAESLINQVKEKVLEKMNSREEVSRMPLDIEGTVEVVAIGAIKYSILRQAIGGDIIFDFDKSISFEGDSGPYLQYSAVRASSVLEKAKVSKVPSAIHLDIRCPSGWQTTNLEKLLERFPNVVEKAGREYAPHHIATHLIDLAGEFNSFYATHKIIDKTDKTSPYKLVLTNAFLQTMTTGLNLLGIKVPERM
ncbi:MAG: arginine--tRNA ligase [Candidatus Zambryskibacteria bacterium RIFCSPHIGHO2_02_39_10]|nr:MAG: arginine--tRNA ligase [Candidatus Zambryskibacteria bacterium RIFCSPHIGHO2_02_39_10]